MLIDKHIPQLLEEATFGLFIAKYEILIKIRILMHFVEIFLAYVFLKLEILSSFSESSKDTLAAGVYLGSVVLV